jgi:hypothetical protein
MSNFKKKLMAPELPLGHREADGPMVMTFDNFFERISNINPVQNQSHGSPFMT